MTAVLQPTIAMLQSSSLTTAVQQEIERAILQRKYPDAVFVSALDRATTRPLIEHLASMLADRWALAARPPETPGEPSDGSSRPPPVDEPPATSGEWL